MNLKESLIVEEHPDVCDDPGPRDELVSHVVVDDEIQVPLSETGFLEEHKTMQGEPGGGFKPYLV